MNANLYILKGIYHDSYYIGISFDIDRRLREHNSGKVTATKAKRPWEIVFSQKYSSMSQAQKIERKIKSWKRRDYIERIVKDKIIRIE